MPLRLPLSLPGISSASARDVALKPSSIRWYTRHAYARYRRRPLHSALLVILPFPTFPARRRRHSHIMLEASPAVCYSCKAHFSIACAWSFPSHHRKCRKISHLQVISLIWYSYFEGATLFTMRCIWGVTSAAGRLTRLPARAFSPPQSGRTQPRAIALPHYYAITAIIYWYRRLSLWYQCHFTAHYYNADRSNRFTNSR